MKKSIVILSMLLLTFLLDMSAQQKIDFYDRIDGYTTNGYIILTAEDGTPTDEVRLVGRNLDMNSIQCYYGGENVPDEVTHDGKTYKVVEFGYFNDYYNFKVNCLKFGKNMRNIQISKQDFYLPDGFELSEENPYYKTIDNILYTADGKTILICTRSLYGHYPYNVVTVSLPDDVETIGYKAFAKCDYININELPKSLKVIEEEAFNGLSNMPAELVVPEGVRVIGKNAFEGTSIRKLTLPSTLEELGDLGYMAQLECIVCQAPTPPAATNGGLYWKDMTWNGPDWNEYYQTALLMVPEESVEMYRKDPDWGMFRNIVAISATGIVPQTASASKDGHLYRLDGTPAQGNKPGIYIQNGRKVVVK